MSVDLFFPKTMYNTHKHNLYINLKNILKENRYTKRINVKKIIKNMLLKNIYNEHKTTQGKT